MIPARAMLYQIGQSARFGKLPAEVQEVLKDAAIDDPAPLASFEASSDVVTLVLGVQLVAVPLSGRRRKSVGG